MIWKPWNPGPSKPLKFSRPRVPDYVFVATRKFFGSKGRLAEHILRVAYISAAINGDEAVTEDCIAAALHFGGWQDRIREVFKPAKGAYEDQECVNAVLEAFVKAPGKAANWRELARKKHWSRKFPRSLSRVKRLLEETGELTLDKGTKKHFIREGV